MILNKVYEANLILTYLEYNDGIDSRFYITEKDNYNLSPDGSFTKICGWYVDSIPTQITVKPTASGLYKAVQGFSHKPTPQEEEALVYSMRTAILDQLKYDKDKYMETYEAKIKALKGEI